MRERHAPSGGWLPGNLCLRWPDIRGVRRINLREHALRGQRRGPMSQQPAVPMPRITPMLLYEDVTAASEWLSNAFGFREQLRFADTDGTVTHAELSLADGVIMLGHPGPDYRSPRRTGQVQSIVHLYVDDVDGHFTRARDAGATILEAPTD